MRALFCLFLFLNTALNGQVTLVKGPYLQTGTPGSMIVKWETNIKTDTKLNYGASPSFLNLSYTNSIPDTAHVAYLSGLNPHTKYYYSIGSGTATIQGDTNNYFVTSPSHGLPGKYRFWITGDCGNASVNQSQVRDSYISYNGNRITDGWLLLGDNAYNDGLNTEYNTNFFNYYQGNIMKKAVLWPSPGNHDYANNLVNQNSHNVAYYSIFNLPSGGEAGGVWSGTEAFYSFNYGNIHFVSLDSYGHELNQYRLYDTLGPQVTWLKQDLASNSLPWVVAYWHHPPYTMASHNSDTEGELDSLRKNLVRILERYNVDFVFCGHSHGYERSKLMNGHWGYENSFITSAHHVSSSTGLYNGSVNSCPYLKNSTVRGTIYVVAGSAGALGGQQASFPHDAMYYSNNTDGGSVVFDVEENKATVKWLCADGVIRDNFTVMKNINHVFTYSVTSGQGLNLVASWPGQYIWSNSSDTLRSHSVVANNDTVFWVKDKYSCIADTFKIKVHTGINELKNSKVGFVVFPTPSPFGPKISFDLLEEKNVSISFYGVDGKEHFVMKNILLTAGKHVFSLESEKNIPANGVFVVKLKLDEEIYTQKAVITK